MEQTGYRTRFDDTRELLAAAQDPLESRLSITLRVVTGIAAALGFGATIWAVATAGSMLFLVPSELFRGHWAAAVLLVLAVAGAVVGWKVSRWLFLLSIDFAIAERFGRPPPVLGRPDVQSRTDKPDDDPAATP